MFIMKNDSSKRGTITAVSLIIEIMLVPGGIQQHASPPQCFFFLLFFRFRASVYRIDATDKTSDCIGQRVEHLSLPLFLVEDVAAGLQVLGKY